MNEEPEEFESFPLRSVMDSAILMHRDCHFDGQFSIMLDYYQKGGKGVCADFEIERIENLTELEKKANQNLSPLLLTGSEAELVARAKNAYKKLRSLYENQTSVSNNSLLIADLILSEEENPESEIAAIVEKKEAVIPLLINLLRSGDFYDPLFPGYGQAPMLAAKCLGRIGDKQAIISLFEVIGTGDLAHEDTVLAALKSIGAPAKDFLVKVVQGRPLNTDNERAAIALVSFKEESDVALVCLNMLKNVDVWEHHALATYLVLCCEGLKEPSQREEFLSLANAPRMPRELSQDIKAIGKTWEEG